MSPLGFHCQFDVVEDLVDLFYQPSVEGTLRMNVRAVSSCTNRHESGFLTGGPSTQGQRYHLTLDLDETCGVEKSLELHRGSWVLHSI